MSKDVANFDGGHQLPLEWCEFKFWPNNLTLRLTKSYLHFLIWGNLSVNVATTLSKEDATEVTPSSMSMKKKRKEKSWGQAVMAAKPSGRTTNTRPGPAVTKFLISTPVMCWNHVCLTFDFPMILIWTRPIIHPKPKLNWIRFKHGTE